MYCKKKGSLRVFGLSLHLDQWPKPMASLNEMYNRLANAHNDLAVTQMFMLESVA